VLASGAAACGDDDTSTDSNGTGNSGTDAGLAEARKLSRDAQKPVRDWVPPGESFDAAKAAGGSIWYISVLLSNNSEALTFDGIEEAAKAVDAKAVGFDGKGAADEFTRGVRQAIAAKASAIILGGIEPKLVAPALSAAKAADIPVVALNTNEPGAAGDVPDAVVSSVAHSYLTPAKWEADFVTADSDGTANVIFLGASDVATISGLLEDGFKSELERVCPDCELELVDVPVAQWSTLQTKTASLLRSKPDVDYLVPAFDGMALNMLPGVRAAGAVDRVKLVSFNGTPAVMDFLKDGNVVAGDVGLANVWQGWGAADVALRAIAGADLVDDIKVPERLFTEANIDEIDLTAPESTWYGAVDFRTLYKKQWGVE
jgi:ribose transport system substrate-binding protein